MDKTLELTIRKAAKFGEQANCPTQLRPAEIGALLKEIDDLRGRVKPRIPEVAHLPVTFHAKKDHVVAVFTFAENQTIGLRFEAPEQMLEFFSQMMKKAALVWPNNEWIKEYLR